MKISEREILEHAGKISHEIAIMEANEEYLKFVVRSKNELSPVEKHFLESIDATAKQLKENKSITKDGKDKNKQ